MPPFIVVRWKADGEVRVYSWKECFSVRYGPHPVGVEDKTVLDTTSPPATLPPLSPSVSQ